MAAECLVAQHVPINRQQEDLVPHQIDRLYLSVVDLFSEDQLEVR